MLWSLELLGSRPSTMASTESLSLQWEAETGALLASVQGRASAPEPMTGKDEIRSRAAPMGTRVTVSIGSSDAAGLGWSLPTIPRAGHFPAAVFFGFFRLC